MIVSHALASITYLLIITSFYFILKQVPVPPFLFIVLLYFDAQQK